MPSKTEIKVAAEILRRDWKLDCSDLAKKVLIAAEDIRLRKERAKSRKRKDELFGQLAGIDGFTVKRY